MNYFHRTKDISLSKLEVLADYFHMTLYNLCVGRGVSTNYVPGDNNTVSCNFVNSDLYNEKIALQRECEGLKERIRDLQGRLNDKDTLILMQSQMIDKYKEQS